MSDWYRNERSDERGRGEDGGRRQRDFSGRDRWYDRSGYGAERRSFDEDEDAYGVGYAAAAGRNYGGGGYDYWRAEQGPGMAQRSEGYGGRGYGRQDYGGRQAYGAQGYAGGSTGGHGWRGSSYERGMGGDYGRGYDYQRERGYGAGGGGTYGGETADPYTQRVADGDFGGWRENINEGRERDERRAGDHRGRGPKNYTRSDERIREDVNDKLTDDPRLDASEIEVGVKDCEVTLSGTVKAREDKRRAEDIAENVSGVKHVQCNLRVEQMGQSQAGEHGARATPGGGMAAQGRTAGTA